ncbi:MAG TPA: hypothetical protein VMD02_06740 [Candidatus Omnitrophota bacterium]|nr:hypothetical protein [Candidatus Omnitrophota bacterium]
MGNNVKISDHIGPSPVYQRTVANETGRISTEPLSGLSAPGAISPIGENGSAIKPIPVILTVSGYTGCGKTSIAKMLVKRMGFELSLLSTTRPPAANEADGVDYHFTGETEFLEAVRHGEIIACEGGYGTFYGVRKEQIEQLIAAGKSGIVVAGASIMDSLRDYFSGRTDVIYRSIYVKMAGTPREQYDAIAGRIHKRAREEGRDASDRLAKISADAIEAYDARAQYYDFEIVNDDFTAAGRAIRDYVASVRQGETIEKTKRIPIQNTPAVILARYLFKRIAGRIAAAAPGIDFSSYDSVRRDINKLLAEDLYEFAGVIYREYHGTIDEKNLKTIHGHILDVAAGIIQTKVAVGQLEKEQKGVGKLATIDDKERAHRNLETITAISSKYSVEHLLYLALMHDLTKLVEWYVHPERSYDTLGRLSLLSDLKMPEADQAVYHLATRYHVLLTSCIMPDLSARSFVSFLKDPQVQKYIAPEGGFDAGRAAKLLDSIFLLTIADISPYGAALTNLKYEQILAHREMLLSAIGDNRNWQAAITAIGNRVPALNKQYLGMVIGISDPAMDSKQSVNQYWKIIEHRMNELVASGELTEAEKELIINHVDLIESSPYPPYNYLARVMGSDRIANGLAENPNLGFFKYLLFSIRLATSLHRSGQTLRFCFLNSDGKYIAEKEELQAAALELAKLMAQTDIKIETSGKSVELTDLAGKPINGLEVTVEENGVEGAMEVNFKLTEVKPKR